MSDKWMNIGCELNELKPYLEPTPDFKDEKRMGKKKCLRLVPRLSHSPLVRNCFWRLGGK